MHDTAFRIGGLFIKNYSPARRHTIIEVGSMNINGALREHANDLANYIGLDVAHGIDVDLVVEANKPLSFRDEYADIVISSSQLEHDRFFWLSFLEMMRIVKLEGYVYINAPSNGYFHRYPVDCWRFYPDAGFALESWANYNGIPCTLVESFTALRQGDIWNDFVAIFQKCDRLSVHAPAFLSDSTPNENLRTYDSDDQPPRGGPSGMLVDRGPFRHG